MTDALKPAGTYHGRLDFLVDTVRQSRTLSGSKSLIQSHHKERSSLSSRGVQKPPRHRRKVPRGSQNDDLHSAATLDFHLTIPEYVNVSCDSDRLEFEEVRRFPGICEARKPVEMVVETNVTEMAVKRSSFRI